MKSSDNTDVKAIVLKYMRRALAESHGDYHSLSCATLRLMGQDGVLDIPKADNYDGMVRSIPQAKA